MQKVNVQKHSCTEMGVWLATISPWIVSDLQDEKHDSISMEGEAL